MAIPIQRKRAATPTGRDALFQALATLSRAIGKTYDLHETSSPAAIGTIAGEPEALEGPLADLRDLALEHERLWGVERERRRRGEALEALLPALAGALDVREVFTQVSVVAQRVLPHAFLGLLDEERQGIRASLAPSSTRGSRSAACSRLGVGISTECRVPDTRGREPRRGPARKAHRTQALASAV